MAPGTQWYYFDSTGAMVTGKLEIDGRMNKFSDSGAWLGYGYAHGKRYDAL